MERDHYQKLDQLILAGETGPINVLAKKMELTPRQVKYMLEVMKNSFGCPIVYLPSIRSYYYTEPGQCILGFHKSKVDDMLKELETLRKILETMRK